MSLGYTCAKLLILLEAATSSVSSANALSATIPAGGVVLDANCMRRLSSPSSPFSVRRWMESVSGMFVDTSPTSDRFVLKFPPWINASGGDFDFHINDYQGQWKL